ncbi:Fe-S cluster assembly protein HesB [Mumia zhuanghuii]|uniref:Fe-S cluster assembly protein HesB n=2 Tax=Mumia TaxID=1546255 RepID=A0ABW1QPL3_9ACTN|nr:MULTISPECIES: Fe-S cluster assembly protein HesB [Mumia]KAA1420725.1 Fe-S cluster assembly protein HesB [Mumia zhuanghuii]
MLTLTENATEVVTALVADRIDTADAGLRISGPTDGSFAVAAVPVGEPGDQVVESGGAKVYIEGATSELLDDKVLDAQVTPEGGVQFALGQQPG